MAETRPAGTNLPGDSTATTDLPGDPSATQDHWSVGAVASVGKDSSHSADSPASKDVVGFILNVGAEISKNFAFNKSWLVSPFFRASFVNAGAKASQQEIFGSDRAPAGQAPSPSAKTKLPGATSPVTPKDYNYSGSPVTANRYGGRATAGVKAAYKHSSGFESNAEANLHVEKGTYFDSLFPIHDFHGPLQQPDGYLQAGWGLGAGVAYYLQNFKVGFSGFYNGTSRKTDFRIPGLSGNFGTQTATLDGSEWGGMLSVAWLATPAQTRVKKPDDQVQPQPGDSAAVVELKKQMAEIETNLAELSVQADEISAQLPKAGNLNRDEAVKALPKVRGILIKLKDVEGKTAKLIETIDKIDAKEFAGGATEKLELRSKYGDLQKKLLDTIEKYTKSIETLEQKLRTESETKAYAKLEGVKTGWKKELDGEMAKLNAIKIADLDAGDEKVNSATQKQMEEIQAAWQKKVADLKAEAADKVKTPFENEDQRAAYLKKIESLEKELVTPLLDKTSEILGKNMLAWVKKNAQTMTVVKVVAPAPKAGEEDQVKIELPPTFNRPDLDKIKVSVAIISANGQALYQDLTIPTPFMKTGSFVISGLPKMQGGDVERLVYVKEVIKDKASGTETAPTILLISQPKEAGKKPVIEFPALVPVPREFKLNVKVGAKSIVMDTMDKKYGEDITTYEEEPDANPEVTYVPVTKKADGTEEKGTPVSFVIQPTAVMSAKDKLIITFSQVLPLKAGERADVSVKMWRDGRPEIWTFHLTGVAATQPRRRREERRDEDDDEVR